MKYGVLIFPTDYSITPAELARAAEERGFESLFFPEHTHIPASRKSPWPGGAELPKEYSHSQDPFVALAMAAAVTKKLKVGTGICLVIERDPITLAKEIASLDSLSGGRFIFGIGAGWNVEEMANHGTAFKGRWKVLRERVEAMKAIWANDEASYEGEHVKFERIWSWPKPAQKPNPPILLGGHGPKALARVVRYCDGWLPIAGRDLDIGARAKELRDLAEKEGRDPRSISITVFGGRPDPKMNDAYEKAGVERVILTLKSETADKVLPRLDDYAKTLEAVR